MAWSCVGEAKQNSGKADDRPFKPHVATSAKIPRPYWGVEAGGRMSEQVLIGWR